MGKSQKIRELEKSGVKLPGRVVERRIIKTMIPWIERDEIIVLIGARQTGKSVLLYQLIYEHLLPKTCNIYYFNLDIAGQLEFFKTPDNLIDLVEKSKGRTYVFIDEVQRLKEAGIFLKGLYDLHLPLKLIVSGSSALEIKSKVQEALTGRKAVFHLNAFNLEELSEALFPKKRFTEVLNNGEYFAEVFEHYLTYGGYPAVALAKNKQIKLRLLQEVFRSYMEKDIKAFLKIDNETAFRNLVKILSSQIGNLVNKDELANTLGIHKHTLDNYLLYLEETFILDFVRPFYKNRRRELLKSPKVYFRDLGLRNFAIGDFNNFQFRPDKGEVFENFSYLCLKEKLAPYDQLYFWRTKAGAEVDFVAVRGLLPVAFEAKAGALKEYKISKSLRSFLGAYHPRQVYCINTSIRGRTSIKNSDIFFITPADLLKLNFNSSK